ncbi:unnamed protein product [Adineta steineri]|uniref:G-protein coupled receptors family 1 profile domain-containing protein n=1 Tax=Adineta steineri TaxID=433720 RepID=A0A814EIQ1_9BILA|nr:unnamed protein product [Adineta steineri]CAF0972819.1 unnamed protein product [Adineta steineri]
MLNIINSSSSSLLSDVRHIFIENNTSSSASIWIINERNSTPLNIDTHQSSVRIMWYRFLLVIVIFITAAGNLLVCLAIARERKLQNTTNYFLMSLAIADCLVAILVMPIGMISEVLGYFPLPHYACIAFTTIDVLCCTSSIWHMSTMSMDRYFTIRFPFRYGRNKTRRIMLLKIIAVWAISAAVSSPIFVLGIVDKTNVLSDGICAPTNPSFKIYGSIFAFYIPFIIMITTYALTMRSLRNVLVNKKKYDRERRRKQTFRPLAQIINQYAEIAQGIRRTSSTKKQTVPTITTTITNTNNHMNSILNKTPYTIITTISPTDSRAQFFSVNNTNGNLQQDNNLINLTNGINLNNELIHHHSQHLTINYIKPSGSKKRRHQQQQQQQQALTINAAINRTKNNGDMSTVYEITENSKSISSSCDVSAIVGNNTKRRSIVSNELQLIEQTELSQNSNLITTDINDIVPLEEEEVSFVSDLDDAVNLHDTFYVQIASSSSQHSSLSYSNESILLTIPWKFCTYIIHCILQYYIFYFPYRLKPLSIEYISNINEKLLKFHQSTSTSSIHAKSIKNHQSVSTQTNSFTSVDIPNDHATNIYENCIYNSSKRRKFLFNRQILSSSSLITNFFRHSPTIQLRASDSSIKSTLSYDPRSSVASSSNQQRQHYSSSICYQTESERKPMLTAERRSRTSSSSSCLLHTSYRQQNHTSTHFHKPLRRHHYQSQSAYAIANPPKLLQQLSSATNTNSSDSSSIMHRYHSKLLSTVSHNNHHYHHRVRVEDFVAANERKALRVLMIIFCVFITLWTPFFICTFISAVCEQCRERLSSNVWFSITWLGYSSSMANPFIYTIFSDVFRRAFINIIFCRSNDLLLSRQLSTKSSYPRGSAHLYRNERLSNRRNLNHDVSGTSTPIPLHYPAPPVGVSDAIIYMNRCTSDACR